LVYYEKIDKFIFYYIYLIIIIFIMFNYDNFTKTLMIQQNFNDELVDLPYDVKIIIFGGNYSKFNKM